MHIRYARVDSPVGSLLVAVQGEALYQLEFPLGPDARRQPEPGWIEDARAVAGVAGQLAEYFAGTRRRFDLTLAPRGTHFQRAVWHALTAIPYGETRSYADIARAIGRQKAVRAVGAANGANPMPIVVPCHRVIGSDGSLTGFGGGLPVKRYLLSLERGGEDLFA